MNVNLPQRVEYFMISILARFSPWFIILFLLFGFLFPSFTMASNTALPPGGNPKQTAIDNLQPPFVKAWELDARSECRSMIALDDHTIAFGAEQSYGVFDIRNGVCVWRCSFALPEFSTALAYDGRNLFVQIGSDRLLACDPRTGAERWSLPVQTFATMSSVDHGFLYVSLAKGKFAAVDLRAHRVVWTADFAPTFPDSDVRIAPRSVKGVIAMAQGVDYFGFSAKTGKLLWHLKRGPLRGSLPSAISAITCDDRRFYVLDSRPQIAALEPATGETVWISTAASTGSYNAAPLRVGNTFYTSAYLGWCRANDIATGKLLWERQVAPPPADDPDYLTPPIRNGASAEIVISGKHIDSLDLHSGKTLWRWGFDQDPLAPNFCLLQAGRLLIASRAGIYCFQHGIPHISLATHAERLALARQLTARLGSLNRDEERTLRNLGAEAFEALLPVFRTTALDYVKVQGSSGLRSRPKALEALREVMQSKDVAETQAVLALLHDAEATKKPHGFQKDIIDLLAEHGNPPLVLPTMLAALETLQTHNPYEMFDESWGALTAVAESSDPRAVHKMMDILVDPRADPALRSEAYIHLPITGGPAGIDAVLAERNAPLPALPSFAEQMNIRELTLTANADIYRVPAELLEYGKDADGITWGLIASPIFGSWEDLWIARRNAAGKFESPTFTGVNTQIDHLSDHQYLAALVARRGQVPLQTDGARWITEFVHNPALTQDSDGDGVTDLVEKRWGTNPHSRSTDGTGASDGVSHSPRGARAPSGDAEEVLAAAFDARTHFHGAVFSEPLVVNFPKGTHPFALTGYPNRILGFQAGEKLPSGYGDGQWIRFVNFVCPVDRKGHNASPFAASTAETANDVIVWNVSHTEATVAVAFLIGGTGSTSEICHLRKIAGHWFVVKLTLGAIS